MSDLISRQAAIEKILGQPPEAHYPSWYAAQIEKLPPAPPEYLAKQAGILVTDTDTISRKAAIEALRTMQTYKLFAGDDMLLIDQAGAQTELMMLPPAQPAIVPCDYAKACNEVAMNRITSAVVYMEILEDFKEYGYVLVDMREVKE